jgi:ABC-type glycerol-3-phosphate transport system permease component
MFPFLWMFLSSLKPQNEIFQMPPTFLPANPVFTNYLQALDIIEPKSNISVGLRNSATIAAPSTVVVLFLSTLAGYSLGRMSFPSRRLLLASMLILAMLPPVMLAPPLYVFAKSVGLLNKRIGLGLAYTALNLPFATWLLSVLFQSVPSEVEEAARIDGCDTLGIIFRIIAPLSLPAITVAGILVFLNCWNEFLMALVLLSSPSTKTAPLSIVEMRSAYYTRWSVMTAGAILQIVPALAVALLLQRYIVQGLTMGALK